MRKYIVTVVVILSNTVIGCKKEARTDIVEKENPASASILLVSTIKSTDIEVKAL